MGENRAGDEPSKGGQIYVEIRIRTSMEKLWELSQNPDLHTRWDLRFSRIVHTDHGPDGPDGSVGLARFRYEFRLPFHTITGTGTTLGNKLQPDGQSTSVLKFSTADWLSPIGPGAGYWRYIPTDSGIRFITGYNYQPGLGVLGRLLDRRVIRPALGWATALSFDRLRLWAESDIGPEASRNAWILDSLARAGGLVLAARLVKGPTARPAMSARVALAVAMAAGVLLVPAHGSVPRARRCLRRPPDSRSAQAPTALAGLAEPDGSSPVSNAPARLATLR